jgi:hypothetical protein
VERQQLISPDGKWWWDGQKWNPIQGVRVDVEIPIHRAVGLKYSRDIEPEEVRARFGSLLTAAGFVLTLPAMGAGTIFSMAIATGQSPLWPTAGEGVAIFLVILGFLGSWPLLGLLLGFGLRDGLRWVALALLLSGVLPALVIGILAVASSGNTFDQIASAELALSWMWALPALGLVALRATHTGRRLPRLRAFGRMFTRAWASELPGAQTQWGEIVPTSRGRYVLRVPGADFYIPPELWRTSGPMKVTYDLQTGRIETIQASGDSSDPRWSR